MKVLGISAYYHDSAAALVAGGEIVAAAHEERFSRRKHDPRFPAGAIRFCLSRSGLSLRDLDAVVFYDKPLLKFERLIETYRAFVPRGVAQFVTAMPVWMKEKLFLREVLRKEMAQALGRESTKAWKPGTNGPELLFSEHHLSHAASAFFPSPFREAAIVTVDGVGEWATGTIARGEGSSITLFREQHFPHSVGLLYSALTYFLGFKVNSGEYKLMGLAPYGDPASSRVADYENRIRERLVDVKEDGSIWLNMEYFDFAAGLKMIRESKLEELFGFVLRKEEDELQSHHCDLALAIQRVTEDIVLKLAGEAKRLTGSSNLCLAGGVALNCVANAAVLRSGLFDGLFIQPAAGDAGGALGAALAVSCIRGGRERRVDGRGDAMKGSFLGPDYSEADVEGVARRHSAPFLKFDDFDRLCDEVAGLLDDGKVVGWFQGRMEWGPRALGNRSILADARNPEMQKKLNLAIKYREGFRPFAPVVPEEDARKYFEISVPSPYMLLVADVVPERRRPLPDGYRAGGWREQLYFERSDIPAVTHIDFSARLQTVSRATNERYWKVLKAFERRTGCAVLVNTSFNVRGEPIVCTPDDAYRCFMATEMDFLVMGNCLFDKEEQDRTAGKWKREFEKD